MKVIIKALFHRVLPRKIRTISAYLFLALGTSVLPFFNVGNAYAQAQQAVVPDDRAPRPVRYPAPTHLRDLQTDRDYQYGQDAPPPENPIARLFNWLLHKLAKFLESSAYQNIWQYILLAAIAGLVIYLLMKAEILSFLFAKKPQSDSLDYETLSENIHDINFGTAIEEAINQRNFRLAVRLLYLQTIKHLTDTTLIDYKPEETNRQYVYELANSPKQAGFEQLTRQFEFIWYGDFPVDDGRFQQIRDQFREFNRGVSQSNTVN